MADAPARSVSGRKLVLPLFLVIALAAVVVGVYKSQEQAGPPLRFERVGVLAGNTTAPANATALPFKPVHDAYFLEDHLVTAAQKGNSTESIRLRVETMQDTLRGLTGHGAPWLVVWNSAVVRVTLDAA